jgi:hypothetical protein
MLQTNRASATIPFRQIAGSRKNTRLRQSACQMLRRARDFAASLYESQCQPDGAALHHAYTHCSAPALADPWPKCIFSAGAVIFLDNRAIPGDLR